MRQFREFYSNDEGQAWVEVYCYALPQGEIEELIDLLRDKGFQFQNIQEDSISARLEGKYNEVWEVANNLQTKEGFYWSKEAKELEEKGEVASREELEENKVEE